KPDNLHVGDDGIGRLFDLGVSKYPKEKRLTTGGTTLGTIHYMSPEQLRHPQTIDPRSDLFSFGIILYELISGKYAFAVDGVVPQDPFGLGYRTIHEPHLPLREAAPYVPPYIEAIVERCLQKKPEDRYVSAEDLWVPLTAALERLLMGLGENAPPPIAE